MTLAVDLATERKRFRSRKVRRVRGEEGGRNRRGRGTVPKFITVKSCAGPSLWMDSVLALTYHRAAREEGEHDVPLRWMIMTIFSLRHVMFT